MSKLVYGNISYSITSNGNNESAFLSRGINGKIIMGSNVGFKTELVVKEINESFIQLLVICEYVKKEEIITIKNGETYNLFINSIPRPYAFHIKYEGVNTVEVSTPGIR